MLLRRLRQTHVIAILSLVILYVSAARADAGARVLTLTARSGAPMRVLVGGDPATATANLILLAGGDGRLKLAGDGEIGRLNNNFLVRSRGLFVAEGFLTAVVDAPRDRWEEPGLLGGFRASPAHAADLAAVAAALTARNGKPVIVVGTSRGSVSAANLAARHPAGAIRAAVLTSSLVWHNSKGASLRDLPMGRIEVPVLFVHNRRDDCKVTRLADLQPVIATMKRAGVPVELVLVESSARQSPACEARGPHGFLGIEKQVVGRIAGWIRSRL